MPTKWLQERADGSKNGHRIGFEGPGVEDRMRPAALWLTRILCVVGLTTRILCCVGLISVVKILTRILCFAGRVSVSSGADSLIYHLRPAHHLRPEPYTINSRKHQPRTTNFQPQIPNRQSPTSDPDPTPQTPNPKPQPQPQNPTPPSKSSNHLRPEPYTINSGKHQPRTPNFQPQIPNRQPPTSDPDPKPQTPTPQPPPKTPCRYSTWWRYLFSVYSCMIYPFMIVLRLIHLWSIKRIIELYHNKKKTVKWHYCIIEWYHNTKRTVEWYHYIIEWYYNSKRTWWRSYCTASCSMIALK